MVDKTEYYKNYKIIEIDSNAENYNKLKYNSEIEYYKHIYSFNPIFKKGINILSHSYIFEMGYNVENDHILHYVLTTACRWANKQIDDFTLIIDMGDFQSYYIKKGFYKKAEEWLLNGIG